MWHADLHGAGQGRKELAGTRTVDGDFGQPRECLGVQFVDDKSSIGRRFAVNA